jgi:hypothetical protein
MSDIDLRKTKNCAFEGCTKDKLIRSVWCHKHRPKCSRKCKCTRCQNTWNGKKCQWVGCNEEFHCAKYKNFTMCEIHRNNEEDEFQPGMQIAGSPHTATLFSDIYRLFSTVIPVLVFQR